MPKSPKIVVGIPCYNCENQIGRVLAGFDDKLLARIEKIIVIDNQSPDGTIKAALAGGKHLGDKLEVYRNDNNYWLGGSHKVAFLYGEKLKADYVAIVHGDDQATTPELNLLIDEAIKQPDAAAILGSRFSRGSKLVGYAQARIWGNRVLNALYSIVSGHRTNDLGSGLNLFRLKDLADHAYLGYGDNMTFNIDLLLGYYTKHAKLIFYPITWSETDQVSNARNTAIAKMAFNKLMAWRFGRLTYPTNSPKQYPSTRQK